MKMTVDTEAPGVQFRDDFSPAAGGLFNLANSLWNAPNVAAQTALQRQALLNQSLFRYGGLAERQRHDLATEDLGNRKEGATETYRNEREARIAAYEQQRLLEYQRMGKKPGDPGTLAPAAIIDRLSNDMVAVPKMDAFGNPMVGPDGKPVVTYQKQPAADARKRLIAAGIDPDTLRYIDPASAKPAPPAGATTAPVALPAASPGPGAAPAPGPAGAPPPAAAAGAPPAAGDPSGGQPQVSGLFAGIGNFLRGLFHGASGGTAQNAPPDAAHGMFGQPVTGDGSGILPQATGEQAPPAPQTSTDPAKQGWNDPAMQPLLRAQAMDRYRFAKSVPGTDAADATADKDPDLKRLRVAMSLVPPSKQQAVFQARVAPLLNPDGSVKDRAGAQALTADILHTATVTGAQPVMQDSNADMMDDAPQQAAGPMPAPTPPQAPLAVTSPQLPQGAAPAAAPGP